MTANLEIGILSPTRYFSCIAVVLGLLFAMISADDASEPLIKVLLVWQVQTCLPMLLLVAAHILLHKISAFDRLNPWLKLAIAGFFGSLLFSPNALLIDIYLFDQALPEEGWILAWWEEFSAVCPPVLVSWIAINAPWVLGLRLEQAEAPSVSSDSQQIAQVTGAAASEQPETSHQTETKPAFFELMPPHLQTSLVYIKAELHYISVVTSAGRHLILYNLKDAIEELAAEGLQPHRSYWVATYEIKKFTKHGREGALEMSNGDTVPVSRRNIRAVQASLTEKYVNNISS